jgi:hypothetical protein
MNTSDIRRRVAEANPLSTPATDDLTPAQENLLAELLASPRTGRRRRRFSPMGRIALAAALVAGFLAIGYAVVRSSPDRRDEVPAAAPRSSTPQIWTGAPAPRSVQEAFNNRNRLPDGSNARDASYVDPSRLPALALVGEAGRYRAYATSASNGDWCAVEVEQSEAGPRLLSSNCFPRRERPAEDRVLIISIMRDVGFGRVPNERARTVTFEPEGSIGPVTTPVGRYGFFIASLPTRVGDYYLAPSRHSGTIVARDANGEIVARSIE